MKGVARVVRASCYRYCLWRPAAASVCVAIQRQGVVTDTDAVARPLIISSRLLSVFCELTNDTDPSLTTQSPVQTDPHLPAILLIVH